MTRELVSIVMGSDSDLEVMQECASVLKGFGIPYQMQVISAHRVPARVAEFAASASRRGVKVIVAGAGAAAHLAGAVAANTTLPVIGVPLAATLSGFDALLSTVQMPAGIPVATVAVGKAGAKNAGILAAQILALSDPELAKALDAYKNSLAADCEEKNKKLQEKLKDF
ncbi:MAG: N5-carboxyaminoimidazole ribonucleotide mutase [Candidatus Omnitrophica bacterium ADurb.Bin277]|nr:MAG: N5-carboxyaminoimidazole ribonucleotide mutase [Candidatus Omnitrophica bacterium ADurb.Bin277]